MLAATALSVALPAAAVINTGTDAIVAIRAIAYKFARAAYYMLREQKPFEASRLFVH
jgi:hypothetical protein